MDKRRSRGKKARKLAALRHDTRKRKDIRVHGWLWFVFSWSRPGKRRHNSNSTSKRSEEVRAKFCLSLMRLWYAPNSIVRFFLSFSHFLSHTHATFGECKNVHDRHVVTPNKYEHRVQIHSKHFIILCAFCGSVGKMCVAKQRYAIEMRMLHIRNVHATQHTFFHAHPRTCKNSAAKQFEIVICGKKQLHR